MEEETKKAVRLTPEQIIAKVDQAGDLDAEIKRKAEEFKALREELQTEAAFTVDGGQAVVYEGNVFQATVAFTAEFNDLEGIELEIDPVDNDQGEKLVPWKGEVSHKEFIGGPAEIKALKERLDEYEDGTAFFKTLFKHVPDSRKRTPNETKLGNMARTAVKKHAELRDIVLKFVKGWTGKSIALVKKD